ncbi:amino acid ABC transporter permease [Microbacterium sp. EYE_5]|uniref:amino acid ABC transporter permease n=1 Tax=unclassified Microbacterium TaxID=2609290 RepID=UPI002003568B|nr:MULTISPECIES: amino acid ABC transporter permease [unclassified Microbacterium]MCK6081887.1 amino acid ABC transporter permease [Microbacterium sp. EYE_382]MCK6087157.1 amino acid ABC transporter permease [Microbacterium sp. EYE_384]MCK6124865.1 amino acid ABC transporter permease [Microbacterium sp. EYE_80]MCK6127920.1 amino acid ABC transporter permease [Microbacterium sp. EYE_79]MCK6142841.1 amino acid ABC transporter permease [Microbacterium sp. EYE_39]
MSSVLYDVPGPRAVARNRIIGVVTILLVAAVLGFLVWRLVATGQFTAEKWYAFSFTNVWISIAEAAGNTLAAFAVAAVGALALGFILAIGRLSDHAWVRAPFTAVIEVLRAIPVLVMMFLLYYGLPEIGTKLEPYWAVVIALIAYNGSVLAEVIRAGVEALPRGQKEAGYAIGLRKSGVMRLVLLPQAVRSMMPVIIAQLVVTLKDTALGYIITYEELLFYARFIGSQSTYGSPIVPATIIVGAIYIVLCLLLSLVANRVEKRLRRSPRAVAAAPARPLAETTDTELIAAQKGAGKYDSNAL